MTVFLTILSGVSVYVIGQVILKLFIEPYNRQRETISNVADFLIFHANRFTNPGIPTNGEGRAKMEETRIAARRLASELIVRTQAVPLYERLASTWLMRSLEEIRSAHEGLLSLSNNLADQDAGFINYETAEKVAVSLGISTEFRPNDPRET